MSDLTTTNRHHNLQITCDEIERDMMASRRRAYRFCQKYKTRNTPGYCKLCGEPFDVLLHMHAEQHGYKSAEDMIKADMVVFLPDLFTSTK